MKTEENYFQQVASKAFGTLQELATVVPLEHHEKLIFLTKFVTLALCSMLEADEDAAHAAIKQYDSIMGEAVAQMLKDTAK